MKNPRGRTALLTGASSGIGPHIGARPHGEGASLVVSACHADALGRLAPGLDPARVAVGDKSPMTDRNSLRLPSAEVILSATAHELRLPISHIKGFVTSLRRTDVEWDDETRSEFLAEIDLETDRLADLVDSLMTARTTDGIYKPATDLAVTQPATVVQGALHRIRGLLGQRPLVLDAPASLPSVRIDAGQMERVLANLIHNAIKYSPPRTPISVAARVRVDGELELSVEDEGPGIRPEDRERIFEPFFRKQNAGQSDVSGHGLGLAICQSIVRAHGGRIQVSDRRGGGARFSVFLPAQVGAKQCDGNCQPKEFATL